MEHTKNLAPEYNISVDSCDLDPEVISWFHSSQWDPVYAIGSRLTAYGETLASLNELESLENTLSNYIDSDYFDSNDNTDSDRERIQDLCYKVQAIVMANQPKGG